MKFLSRIFRFKDWSDWERNKSVFQYLKQMASNVLNIDQFAPNKAKNFDTISKRYKLDDTQLSTQAKSLFLLSMILLIFCFLMWTYSFYHFYKARMLVGFVVLCVSSIPLSLAFRYHFYYTLIKHKRLNCTIKEWFTLNFLKD
jgi:intracellular multiplication protein IcmV